MENSITLSSISELLGKNFFIPSYQRGYRWTKQQVEDLLNDIYAFAIKDKLSKKEFYCLQPIVVKTHKWERVISDNLVEQVEGWEVVDGQQRLTTIRILLAYFIKTHLVGKTFKERYNKDVFKIDYETRKNTEEFLINITENNDENIDFYHISQAYSVVVKWFTTKVEKENIMLDDLCDSILRTLVYNQNNQKSEGVVQVIWYQINEKDNAIDTFIRINLGRISLLNSELIKALFLQERDFYKAKENGKDKENEIAKLKQLEIAGEWDKIENALQDDGFWWFINKEKKNIPARIEFIFDFICSKAIKDDPEVAIRKKLNPEQIEIRMKLNPTIEERIGTDRYATFRYFYQKFDTQIDFETLRNEWDSIKEYYLTLEEWYLNPTWYHYIGFLIYCNESLVDIFHYTKYEFSKGNKNETKDDITSSLKNVIKKRFENLKWKKSEQDASYFLDLNYKNEKTKELLLLFNLESIVNQCITNNLIYKFPFKSFKEENWDVEHIDSFTTNPLKTRILKEEWLKTALEDLSDKILEVNLKNQINEYLSNANSVQDFERLQNEIIVIAEENENDEATKNNIGNLTLLDAGTNRGYGNALFPSKRRIIIEKDKQGVFIPICTKNVFLKYFDTKAKKLAKWNSDDIQNYRDVIADTLVDFLPVKP